ncbi:MAG TPA: endonuclease V [Gaiellales bacterium]|jgi:deoxyribonuclease V
MQTAIAKLTPPPWDPPADPLVAGCFVSFPRGGHGAGGAGDPAVAAAVTLLDGRIVATHVAHGAAGAAYAPGLLALREGALLEAALLGLDPRPDVVLLDATGRDHPRRAGLTVHVGWTLDLPTIGVTHRPLQAQGAWPADVRGAVSPLRNGDDIVGQWLRTRAGTRPLAVHAGWRTTAATACAVVLPLCRVRTPEPLRQARRLARMGRTALSAG